MLAHGQEEECEGDGRDDGRAEGEQDLHRVEEEEHHQQRDGRAQGKAEGLHRVQRLHVWTEDEGIEIITQHIGTYFYFFQMHSSRKSATIPVRYT